MNTFLLTADFMTACLLAIMDALKARWCWRKDLAEFRGLSERERTGFLLVLKWFPLR